MGDEINSPVASKINATALGSIVASLVVLVGLDIPADKQVALLTLVNLVGYPAIMVFRTWFTDKRWH